MVLPNAYILFLNTYSIFCRILVAVLPRNGKAVTNKAKAWSHKAKACSNKAKAKAASQKA